MLVSTNFELRVECASGYVVMCKRLCIGPQDFSNSPKAKFSSPFLDLPGTGTLPQACQNFIFIPQTCDWCGVSLGGGGEERRGLHPYLCYLIVITIVLCADTNQDLDKPKFF